MDTNLPRLNVVIPAYNEEGYIGACLDSLAQQTYRNFEVIVVDNNCTDKTAEIATSKGATVVKESQKGIAFARKTGFTQAKNEVIVSTDSDCTFAPNWLEKIATHFDNTKPENKDTVAVYGIGILNSPSEFQRNIAGFTGKAFLWINDILNKKNVCGFNFAVKKSTYELSPKFDTALALSEDVILGLELMKFGKVVLDTDLVVYPSPRRFEKDPLKALWTYTKAYFQVLWLGQRPKAEFEDIR